MAKKAIGDGGVGRPGQYRCVDGTLFSPLILSSRFVRYPSLLAKLGSIFGLLIGISMDPLFEQMVLYFKKIDYLLTSGKLGGGGGGWWHQT